MKSEHLFCNFSHFVLLLLSYSQAVCNLFPQKPVVSLKLEKTVPGEARSKKPCVVDGGDPSPHRPSHPGCSRAWRLEASGLPPCKCSQEALKWGGSPDYSPRSFCCFVCLMLMLFCAQFVSLGHRAHGLSPCVLPVCYMCVTLPGQLHGGGGAPRGGAPRSVPHLPPPSASPASTVPPSSPPPELFFPAHGSDHVT